MQNTRSFLSSEWRFILSVITPVIAVVLAWGAMQTKQAVLEERLDKIAGNELVHIQASLDRVEQQHLEIMTSVAEIKALMKK